MFKMMVVPDYMPDQFSAWYLLNTHLQKNLACSVLVCIDGYIHVAATCFHALGDAMGNLRPVTGGNLTLSITSLFASAGSGA